LVGVAPSPVPPLEIPRVPAIVKTPDPVIGPPDTVTPLNVDDASTLVTVPPLLVDEIVKLGYVPVIVTPPDCVRTTV
jgi:hypothetical protein